MSNLELPSQNKKFPSSKQGKQCLGPCYEPGTYIIHPLTQTPVTVKDEPFCPVAGYDLIDPVTGQKERRYTDECYVPTTAKDASEEITWSILIPTTEFDCSQFLKLYYDIFSFEDSLLWLNDNRSSPFYTKMRIINCALRTFGPEIELVDDNLIDLFIYAIKKEWMKDIYKRVISKYIHIDSKNDEIIVGKKNDNDNNKDKDNKIERINYFIKNFVNKNNVYQILQQYIKDNKKDWNEIENHIRRIKEFSIDYFTNLSIFV